jgi:hypothetical protein
MMGANQNPRKRKPKPVQKPIAVAPARNSANRQQLLEGDYNEEGVYQPTVGELLRLESYEDWRAKRYG